MERDIEEELRRFFKMVKLLRESQKRYFTTRDRDDLELARRNEWEVDKELQRLEGVVGKQKTIF